MGSAGGGRPSVVREGGDRGVAAAMFDACPPEAPCADRGGMTELSLPEPWRSLVREWVPRLLAAWQAEGAEVPGGTVRWMAMPRPPDLLDGAAYFHFGPVVYACRCGSAVGLSERAARGGGRPQRLVPRSVARGLRDSRRRADSLENAGRRAWSLGPNGGGYRAGVRMYPTSLVVVMTGVGDRALSLD